VLWNSTGDSFSAGNDFEDFLKNPPGPGESPQAQLANALLNFDKPRAARYELARLVRRVHGGGAGWHGAAYVSKS
jgi:hypothetical protein